jgi:hypothetical protein
MSGTLNWTLSTSTYQEGHWPFWPQGLTTWTRFNRDFHSQAFPVNRPGRTSSVGFHSFSALCDSISRHTGREKYAPASLVMQRIHLDVPMVYYLAYPYSQPSAVGCLYQSSSALNLYSTASPVAQHFERSLRAQ